MPKGDWGHRGHKGQAFRPHHREFSRLEQTPDLSRGEVRLAAEALLETVRGGEIPESIMHRALSIAGVLARG